MNNVNEKTIIRSERYKIKRAIIIIILLGIIALISLASSLASSYYIEGSDKYDSYREIYNEHQYERGYCEKTYLPIIDNYIVSRNCGTCKTFAKFDNSNFDYAITYMFKNIDFLYWLVIPLVSTALIVFVVWALTQSYELTVTDKRVYGKLLFGIRVDIPIDSISSTSGGKFLSAVSVKSPSSKISFLFVKNNTMVQEKINELIISRSNIKAEQIAVAQSSNDDETFKLEKYKNLLDQGIITQEEFDAKKKQLLGL